MTPSCVTYIGLNVALHGHEYKCNFPVCVLLFHSYLDFTVASSTRLVTLLLFFSFLFSRNSWRVVLTA